VDCHDVIGRNGTGKGRKEQRPGPGCGGNIVTGSEVVFALYRQVELQLQDSFVDLACCHQVEHEVRPVCKFMQRRRVVLDTGSGVDGEAWRLCADACPHRDQWQEHVLVDSASEHRPWFALIPASHLLCCTI
jgi:hypothetical protein